MTGMTPERLAAIRRNLPSADMRDAGMLSRRERDAFDLLYEVDRLQAAWSMADPMLTERDALLAEVKRLRAGIEALADAHCLHDKYAYALLHGDDVQALLNPPTEGETDHE